MTEQRYKAVLAVIGDGRTVTQVARDWEVSRQTVHVWLERYEADGYEGLANRSHRPTHCPHQMPPMVEAQLLEMRRAKPYWGARRLALELARRVFNRRHQSRRFTAHWCELVSSTHSSGSGAERAGSAGSERSPWSSGSWMLYMVSCWPTELPPKH